MIIYIYVFTKFQTKYLESFAIFDEGVVLGKLNIFQVLKKLI